MKEDRRKDTPSHPGGHGDSAWCLSGVREWRCHEGELPGREIVNAPPADNYRGSFSSSVPSYVCVWHFRLSLGRVFTSIFSLHNLVLLSHGPCLSVPLFSVFPLKK